MSFIRTILCLCGVLLLVSEVDAQLSIEIEAQALVDWCEPIEYIIRAENLDEINEADRLITIEFNHSVQLVSSSLNPGSVSINGRQLTVDLGELDACSYLLTQFSVLPNCNQQVPQLIAMPQSPSLGFLPLIITNLNTVALSLAFGEYDYDGATGTLTKIITVTNIGTSNIEEFTLDLSYGNDFAATASTSRGSIESNNEILISNRL